MNVEVARAGADAMASHLGHVFPVAVAVDCANDVAQALSDGESKIWDVLVECALYRGEHMKRTPEGVDPLDVYADVGLAWLRVAHPKADGLVLFGLMLTHEYPIEMVKRAFRGDDYLCSIQKGPAWMPM